MGSKYQVAAVNKLKVLVQPALVAIAEVIPRDTCRCCQIHVASHMVTYYLNLYMQCRPTS